MKRSRSLAVAWAIAATLAAGCETHVVLVQPGDCIDSDGRAVACADGRAVSHVVRVLRSEGEYPACPPGETARLETEGGDGPMIGVSICTVPIENAAPSQ